MTTRKITTVVATGLVVVFASVCLSRQASGQDDGLLGAIGRIRPPDISQDDGQREGLLDKTKKVRGPDISQDEGSSKDQPLPLGTPHPKYPHVVWGGGTKGKGGWIPAPGHTWVDPEDPNDFRTRPLPAGTPHPEHPNVLWNGKDGWKPAKGYTWENKDDPKDLRVRPIAGGPPQNNVGDDKAKLTEEIERTKQERGKKLAEAKSNEKERDENRKEAKKLEDLANNYHNKATVHEKSAEERDRLAKKHEEWAKNYDAQGRDKKAQDERAQAQRARAQAENERKRADEARKTAKALEDQARDKRKAADQLDQEAKQQRKNAEHLQKKQEQLEKRLQEMSNGAVQNPRGPIVVDHKAKRIMVSDKIDKIDPQELRRLKEQHPDYEVITIPSPVGRGGAGPKDTQNEATPQVRPPSDGTGIEAKPDVPSQNQPSHEARRQLEDIRKTLRNPRAVAGSELVRLVEEARRKQGAGPADGNNSPNSGSEPNDSRVAPVQQTEGGQNGGGQNGQSREGTNTPARGSDPRNTGVVPVQQTEGGQNRSDTGSAATPSLGFDDIERKEWEFLEQEREQERESLRRQREELRKPFDPPSSLRLGPSELPEEESSLKYDKPVFDDDTNTSAALRSLERERELEYEEAKKDIEKYLPPEFRPADTVEHLAKQLVATRRGYTELTPEQRALFEEEAKKDIEKYLPPEFRRADAVEELVEELVATRTESPELTPQQRVLFDYLENAKLKDRGGVVMRGPNDPSEFPGKEVADWLKTYLLLPGDSVQSVQWRDRVDEQAKLGREDFDDLLRFIDGEKPSPTLVRALDRHIGPGWRDTLRAKELLDGVKEWQNNLPGEVQTPNTGGVKGIGTGGRGKAGQGQAGPLPGEARRSSPVTPERSAPRSSVRAPIPSDIQRVFPNAMPEEIRFFEKADLSQRQALSDLANKQLSVVPAHRKGATYHMETIRNEIRAGNTDLILEDRLPGINYRANQQGVDYGRGRGGYYDFVQVKHYENFDAAVRDIRKQAPSDLVRYGRLGFRLGSTGKPLSGVFEYRVKVDNSKTMGDTTPKAFEQELNRAVEPFNGQYNVPGGKITYRIIVD